MNPFLPIRPSGLRDRYFVRKPGRAGSASRWWLMALLLTGLSSVSHGQCFNSTTVSLVNSTTFTVDRSPNSVAVGDFNGDGKPDLVTANLFGRSISVLLGNGSGGFGPATNYGVGSGSHSVVVGDFNGDGKPDLAFDDGNNVSVLLGTGSGSFGVPTSFTVGSSPRSLAVGDFNGDGKPDLVTANEGSNSVSVLLGNGSGGFGPATNSTVGTRPVSVAVGDFNGDGKPDLAVANRGSNNVSVLLGNGSGGFGTLTGYAVGSAPQFVAVGDFNSDGKSDLAVANLESASVSVLLGDGSGGFGAATDFAAGGSIAFAAYSLAVGDFNGDGKPDLAVANFNNVSVLLGTGSGSFGVPIPTNVGAPGLTRFVAVGDFNADGRSDLAVTNGGSNSVSVLLGNGSGGFGPAFINSPRSITVGDFNGDGKPDLVTANEGSDNVSVVLSNGSGGFGPPTSYTVGSVPVSVVVGDFNGDGKSDLAVTHRGPSFSSIVSVLLGNGSGSFSTPASTYVGPSSAESTAVGDFNGDSRPDLAVTSYNGVSVLLGTGAGGFGAPASFTVGSSARSVAVADFNGDGKPDLAVTGSDNVSVLLGNGSGGFGPPTSYTVGSDPLSVAVGDFNGDGRPDLAVANFSTYNVSVLLGNGGGVFGPPTTISLGINNRAYSVAVGDFNGDGRPDLAVTSLIGLSVFLGDGSGEFGAPTNFTTGSRPFSGVVADFNGDGRPDLATANSGSNDVSVFLNCSVPAPPPTSPFSITGVTTVSCATVTATERQLTFTPQYAGLNGQPVSFSVVNELVPTSSPGPYTLRLYTDNPTITLKATQTGSPEEASFVYNWLAACRAGSTSGFAITSVTTVSCATVTATERQLTFTPQYAGLNGQPVSFSVVNELVPTSSPGPYTLRLYTDNPTITLKATQTGSSEETTFAYNWLATCGAGGSPRLGAGVEPTATLHLTLLGNPVRNAVGIWVTGAENTSLQLSLTDMLGRLVGERRTERAGATEYYQFDVSAQSAGTLLLRVGTYDQSETVRVLKVN